MTAEITVARQQQKKQPARTSATADHPKRVLKKRSEAIIDLAIDLFNEHGLQNVATNRISAVLGISPGNLHYHFSTKTDIFLAAMARMERDMRNALSDLPSSRDMPAEDAVAYDIGVFTVLWKYRFIFGSLDLFIRWDDKIYLAYMQFHDWIIGRLSQMLVRAIALGQTKPLKAPSSPAAFSLMVWLQWEGWVRWEMIQNSRTSHPADADEAIIHRGVLHHIAFMEPYGTAAFSRDATAAAEAWLTRALKDRRRRRTPVRPGTT